MATLNQIDANRRNAQKCTGPSSPAGKARSALNSTRHGLLARDVVLGDEDPDDFLALLADLLVEYQPVGWLENQLVEQMAASQWRLRRLGRVEHGVYLMRLEQVRREDLRAKEKGNGPTVILESHDELTRLLGISFQRDAGGADSFSKLTRYEAMLRRYFYKALHEFQAAQACRKQKLPNEANSPPYPELPSAL